jgi:hypothetical protein
VIIHKNNERTYIALLIMLLYNSPMIYNIFYVLFVYFSNPNSFHYYINTGVFVFLGIILFFTNNMMLHIVMESNFKIICNSEYFEYKTILRKKEKIYYKDIKKIIICNEELVFKGHYESLIVIRKGWRRSLFFQQFSMKKQVYEELKTTLMHEGVPIQTSKNKYLKPLLGLFLF